MDENCQKVGTRVVVAGTEAYMSPELIAGDPRDAASDWWAFAVVAYECVHGRVPFGSPKSRHPFSSRVHVASARVHFPAADDGGPGPALSEDMKGMIVAMTRRPASGVGLCLRRAAPTAELPRALLQAAAAAPCPELGSS